MINRIGGVVGSLYYVGQAAEANKTSKTERNFNELLIDRVGKVQKVAKLNALNQQEKDIMPQEYVDTTKEASEVEMQPTVLVTHNQKYRPINLDGSSNQADPQLVNPVKIKAAYFNDAL